MSGKCAVIGSCILVLAIWSFSPFGYSVDNQHYPTLTLQEVDVKCELDEIETPGFYPVKPSLSSFIHSTSGEQDSRLSGLAVYLELTDACQVLEDVSKASIQMHKVALVNLKTLIKVNESNIVRNNSQTRCPFQKLAINAQNAGYAVLIHFGDWPNINNHGNKLLIPVLNVNWDNECKSTYGDKVAVDIVLNMAHLTNVEIRIAEQPSFELIQMLSYLNKLYYWFLVGPIITLEWLRRKKKKLCWMSGGQQLDNNGQTDENREAEMRTMEEGGNRTHLNISTQTRDGEEQQLRTTQPTVINDYTRQPRGTGCLNIIRKIPLRAIAVGFLYVILVIAALPVGLSLGGFSFFRFDDSIIGMYGTDLSSLYLIWPTFQIIVFFMYSPFACNITWTIQTEFSKLIRSNWFASNIYLLILGVVVVPFFSPTAPFSYFIAYNTLCTVCSVLFIFILNKHKVVTRYVFYISVCMICAYVESDVAAVFYFVFKSQGSLANLKLAALRTVAIGLTLTISFNSSMHIVRKLVKPRQSLFEGLGEK